MPAVGRGTATLATLATLAMASFLGALGCKDSDPRRTAEADPRQEAANADPHVRRVRVADGEAHFGLGDDAGLVELVPPIALPSSHPELAQVSIRAHVPHGGRIGVAPGPDGPVLVWPPGTRMERLEWIGEGSERSLADVRGATIDAQGHVWHHNYRRTTLGPRPPMLGYAWRSDRPNAHDRAVEALVGELADLPPASHMKASARVKYLDGIRRKDDCMKCHVPHRPANMRPGEHGLVNRGTDGTGFFTPQTVFADAVVLEDYGRFDPNVHAPHVSFACADGAAPARAAADETRSKREKDRVRMRCDRGVVTATYDLAAALAAGDARAARVCASRRWLAARLDEEAMRTFEHAIRICETKN